METTSGIRGVGEKAVTRRLLTLGGTVVVLMAGGWFVASTGRPAALRSQHSEPVTAVPPPLVAITAEGKLYHRPECAYIHGPVRMEPGDQAIAEGYTAWTRCIRR
jgi:hypothetical protein